MNISVLALVASLVLITGMAHAGDIRPAEGGGTVWQAGIDGVEIEWAPDGTVMRLSSTWRHPVVIPDRPGVSKAQIIAEEKAKASIIRYMNQIVSSERTISEINHDLATSSAKTQGGELAISTEAMRRMSESLTETTRSFSAGRLRGVIILEKGFDPKAGEVWVTVGMSKKTMAAASQLANDINATSRDTTDEASGSKSTTGLGGLQPQQAEVRRSRQVDW